MVRYQLSTPLLIYCIVIYILKNRTIERYNIPRISRKYAFLRSVFIYYRTKWRTNKVNARNINSVMVFKLQLFRLQQMHNLTLAFSGFPLTKRDVAHADSPPSSFCRQLRLLKEQSPCSILPLTTEACWVPLCNLWAPHFRALIVYSISMSQSCTFIVSVF